MPLSAGHKIGPYVIVSALGAGGMGEVYRATDTNLGRQVALKVLPPAFANDKERMARFRREAHVLASLNHPNIATIHGIEGNAIVMELVEGKDLAGPLPLDEALPIAKQIIEALEAAHEKGIVHRDLKPANIKITPQGVVKVLDFGLAKAAEDPALTDPSNSPTLSIAGTQSGVIMGTAGYMSPEQASGRSVDRRADIWSFGVVLFEMLSGRKLFEGETIMHTLADVVRGEIDLNRLPSEVPQAIRALIKRCLERDVKRRMQWIGEARIAIEDYLANPNGGPEGPLRAEARPTWLLRGIAVVATLAAIAGWFGWYIATRPAPLRPLVQMNVELDPDAPIPATAAGPLAISPDGSRIVVILRGVDGKNLLYTRLLQQSKLVPLAGTENPGFPFFSADGQWIGFVADGKLKKISADGGAAVAICDAANIRGANWGDDNNIVLAIGVRSALSRVSSAGGTPAPATKLNQGEQTHRWPQVLPGSLVILFTAHSGPDFDNATIEAISVKSGQRKTLVRGGYSGRYLPTGSRKGHLVYMHKDTLFAAPFDPEALALTGQAVPALENVSSYNSEGGRFAFSATGVFLFQAGGDSQSNLKIYLADRSGAMKQLLPQAGAYSSPRFSPDGKRLAFSLSNNVGSDIWVKDMDREAPSRLSFLKGANDSPVWTPDGKNIVFRSTGHDLSGLYWISADGAGEAQRLMDGKSGPTADSFSPDGKRLSFASGNSGSLDLFTALVEGDARHPKLGKPELFLGTTYGEFASSFSPDGRWLAYTSNESGAFEVYVRPFPGPGGRRQISSGGGIYPSWSKDERELFFRGLDYRIMVAGYSASGDSFIPGKPQAWPVLTINLSGIGRGFHVAPDGKHAAVILPEGGDKQKPIKHLTLLLNFFDELQRKAPAK
jgi:Tol biopolymer transport system component